MATSNSESEGTPSDADPQTNRTEMIDEDDATVPALLEEMQDWSPPSPRSEHLTELLANALLDGLETETHYEYEYDNGDTVIEREVMSFANADLGAPVLIRYYHETTTESGEEKERLAYWVGPKGEATLDLLWSVVNARTTEGHSIDITSMADGIIDDLASSLRPVWSDAVRELMTDAAP